MRHMVVIESWSRFGTVQVLFSGETVEGPFRDDDGLPGGDADVWLVRSPENVVVNQLRAVHVEVCEEQRDANLLVHRLYEAGTVLES